MELALYSMWSINVENLVKNKLFICRDYHIQPSEIDRLPYYEYEWYVENIQEIQKKEEEERKRQEKAQNKAMPNMNSFKAPNYSLPKMAIPKF